MQPRVKMVQLTPHNWQIQNETGTVLQTDITAHSEYEAREYVKRWVSSFSGWDFLLVPLEKSIKANKRY